MGDNLAFLRLPHDSLYDSKTSQHKDDTTLEVKPARRKLLEHIEGFSSDQEAMDEDSEEPLDECEETAALSPDEHKVYEFTMTVGQRIIVRFPRTILLMR